MNKSTQSGFTIIEMIIVMGVIAIILPTVFAIMFVVFRQQAKVIALKEVTGQGDFILNSMQTVIKNNAVSVHNEYPSAPANETCIAPSAVPVESSPLVFRDINDNSFYYAFGNSSVSSASSVLAAPVPLNNSRVIVSNFTTSCNRTSQFSQPIITIGFDVSYNTSSSRTEDTARLHFGTKIKMKN